MAWMYSSFDMAVQSDEFAREYEEWLALLDEEWEEPDDWKGDNESFAPIK